MQTDQQFPTLGSQTKGVKKNADGSYDIYFAPKAPKGREGTYTSVISIARTLGWGAGPLIGGFLTESFDINVPFFVMGSLALISLLLIFTALPESAGKQAQPVQVSYREIFRNPTVRGRMSHAWKQLRTDPKNTCPSSVASP